ncbi:hypothetical protein DU500_08745 [Haloplanus rubicundus]|uniref:Uncharacterized protein n=1 Tax=Haloplanus rubicundus TaxID=1547898 RepID=A0A345E2S9_9EURY|nr:DUF5791 family protein [Haloplanus rubicundus]AXG06501.1 hypothetical protein DU500_08745 [Haloplanus rubicundus]AXG09919.1 hypothetical protein DU484_08705 [Haloplanus rubicundus]
MLYDAADEPETLSPEQLRDAYERELRAVVDARGVETVAAEAGVEAETIAALLDGGSSTLTLSEAAAILAVDDDAPDADAIVQEVRDRLLMGMTTGVVDVDTIASNVDLDLSGQEVQQAIEGRIPMTLAELAAIHGYIAGRNAR